MEKKNYWKKYINAMIAGGFSALVFQQLDALRIRLFYKQDNVFRSLTDGITFNVMSTTLKASLNFPVRDTFNDYFLQHGFGETESSWYSSAGAGLALGIVATPLNVIKVPLQASHYPNTLSVIKNVYAKYGLVGFMNGGFATILRNTSRTVCYFPTYDFILKKKYSENKLVASLVAGIFTAIVSYPFDGMRLGRQHGKFAYNLWYGFGASFRPNLQNILSFSTVMIKVPLSTAFTHMTYLYLSSSSASPPQP